MNRNFDHNILPRIIALLLGLAMLSERAASCPPAMRFWICHVFLRAQYAALTLMDFPDENDLAQTLDETPDFLGGSGEGVDTLFHLAMVFRAVAAMLIHACLTDGTPRSITPRYELALSLNFPVPHARGLFQNGVGLVHDTS